VTQARTTGGHHGGHPGDRRSRYLLVMSLGALGVVYGDIGTSPLYALRESFRAAGDLAVNQDTVLGVLSLMVWAMVLVVTVKYLVFVMRADNHGEGGILALTALVLPTGERRSSPARWALILVGLFGTALLYGDGIITPAISVLSAVEGLEVATPALAEWVVPLAAVILVGLFSIQHHGTARVGAVFGPVMVLWFGVLAVLGVTRIVEHPVVLSAVNPARAVSFVTTHPRLSFLALGAIFLVVTGSEALYADMGHFGKRPIRIGWFTLVLPSLVLNYFGQGALVIGDPSAIDNPFYKLPPDWAVGPLVVLATMATVIASQALISGAYSLTMQAAQLGYLPRVKIDHTSPREFGQIYIPAVNWGLMAACVALVVAFGSSSNLAAAYGVAVTSTMLITTAVLYVVMRERWHWSRPLALSLTALFAVIDLAFFAANILKVPEGGWVPLAVGLAVFVLMTTWKRGREIISARLRRGELPIERFIASIVAHPQKRVPGTAVYLFPEPGATPPALLSNLRHHGVVAVKVTPIPRVTRARRATVHDLGEDFWQVVLTFGFMDRPDVPATLGAIVTKGFGFDPLDATYFLGKETIIASARPGMAMWRERLFALLHRNATSPVQYFSLPHSSVMEVGVQLDI